MSDGLSGADSEPPSAVSRRRGKSGRRRQTPFHLNRIVWTACLVGVGMLFASAAGAQGTAAPTDVQQLQSVLIPAFIALLAMSGLVSGSETAIFSLDRLDLVQIRKSSARSTRALRYLLSRPYDTLTTILIANNLVNVALSLIAGALAEAYFTDLPAAGIAIAGFSATALILVFGEVVPKCVAQATAPWIARWLAWPTAIAAQFLTPIRKLMILFIDWVFARLGVDPASDEDVVSEEELKVMMTVSHVTSVLEEDERDMIRGVFGLDETFAEQIMVPRSEVTSFPDTLTQEEMIRRLRETTHSRVLITEDDSEHVIGFVLAKEVLLRPDRDWRESMRDLLCVPPRMRLDELLRQYRRNAVKIAAVVDEYGQFAGIVTLHDLLEEIVGDMAERHETVVPEMLRTAEDRHMVQGRMKLNDLERALDVEFPDDMGTTVAGFVMNMLGRVPAEGAELAWEGFIFRVTRMIGRRILQIEVRRVAPEPEPQAAAGEAGRAGA